MGAHLVQFQLARSVEMVCGVETLPCHFGPYPGCYGDGFKCCFPLYFIPPLADPNPIWPRNGYEQTLRPTLLPMDWPEYDVSIPGKLALGLLVSSRDGEEYNQYLTHRDWSLCELHFRNLIVSDSTGLVRHHCFFKLAHFIR